MLTASEGILEDLLKAQELENGQVDSRMESKTAFVGSKSRVELYAVTLVDHAFALVILPDNSELDDAFGNRDNLECLLVLGVLLEDGRSLESGNEFCSKVNWLLQSAVWSSTYPCVLAQTLAQTL